MSDAVSVGGLEAPAQGQCKQRHSDCSPMRAYQVLEASKRHLAEGRPGSVIADLAPALLGEDVAAARGLRSDRKTFLDALQMLQVGSEIDVSAESHKKGIR